MDVLIILAALALLMYVAYRGLSVILLAPACALLAVPCFGPLDVAKVQGVWSLELALIGGLATTLAIGWTPIKRCIREPHNGAVITLLAITGMTHRDAYRDIFAITLIKTAAVFFVIAVYTVTGWV